MIIHCWMNLLNQIHMAGVSLVLSVGRHNTHEVCVGQISSGAPAQHTLLWEVSHCHLCFCMCRTIQILVDITQHSTWSSLRSVCGGTDISRGAWGVSAGSSHNCHQLGNINRTATAMCHLEEFKRPSKSRLAEAELLILKALLGHFQSACSRSVPMLQSHYWNTFLARALEVSQCYKVTIGACQPRYLTLGGLLQIECPKSHPWTESCAMTWKVWHNDLIMEDAMMMKKVIIAMIAQYKKSTTSTSRHHRCCLSWVHFSFALANS